MVRVILLSACVGFQFLAGIASADFPWHGYVESGDNGEQAREIRFAEGCRAIVLAPPAAEFDPKNPTLLIVFATPNGNTAEQTLGCKLSDGLDWHFDIQHAAAQWRVFRKLETARNVVLACVQANNLSWPTWKAQRPHGPEYIRQIVQALAESLPSDEVRITLTGHSGGGSFIFGYIDAADEIPATIERVAFLDANYGYDTTQKHGEKILRWLAGDKSCHFIVLAYDDRNIELDGKKVVGPTGGTYRATNRMLDFLKDRMEVTEDKQGDFIRFRAAGDRLTALVHPNPENIILHTRLVGEMNGLLEAVTIGTPYHGKWGKLAPPRAYTDRVHATPLSVGEWHPHAPALPLRKADSRGGSEIVQGLLTATPSEREAAIAEEIIRGNVPDFWRQFVEVSAHVTTDGGKAYDMVYRVSPDYLAVGSDDDFVRMPLTPYVAQQIADVLGCVLPTRKMADDIYHAADVKLTPQPLIEDRESLATFLEHHQLIQTAWVNRQPQQLVAGIKKDVVVTNKLLERPNRVAIYGWHKPDGEPIQPLTTVHVDWYVDYSHGVRLIDQWCKVDGTHKLIEEVWRDAELCVLLSDEGPIESPKYERAVPKR